MHGASVEELERAIQQLPGIYDARVFVESGGKEIEKVHVMAAPGRTPKKIVRDIETLLLLQFNVKIDYRKISLVQVRLEDVRPFIRPRLKLRAVETSVHDKACQVRVSLESENEKYIGIADGREESVVLTAQATLDALNSVLGNTCARLRAVEMVSLGDSKVMLVSIAVTRDEGEDRLLGSSFVYDDTLVATARATLDAVNRRFFSA